MMLEYRVIVNRINKKFQRDYVSEGGSLFRGLSFLSRKKSKFFDVLKNISFKLKPEEVLGIIGKNGSGKSTLLRVMADIYEIDSGNIDMNGEVVYLTGFAHGLKTKLTMRENIYLIGLLRGLGRTEIDSKFEEIVEFSGLRDYLDTKVYQFSSGMINRLSFSITVHCIFYKNPEILLIDEAFVSGDIGFSKKGLRKMRDLLKGGSSVVLVSHNLNLIQKYCDKVIWLENGEIKMKGQPGKIIKAYIRKYDNAIESKKI